MNSHDERDESVAERIVDELVPAELDWRRMVRTYPLVALGIAALGGYLVGRRHGPELVDAVRSFVEREVTRNVRTLLGDQAD